MSTQDNLAVARGWAQAAFNQHDLDAAAQFLAPDWVGHWAGMPEGYGPVSQPVVKLALPQSVGSSPSNDRRTAAGAHDSIERPPDAAPSRS